MILEAMYCGDFYPCETVAPTSPKYRKALKTCEKLMEQLFQRLNKEDYELVQELTSTEQQSPNVRKTKATSSMVFRLG